MTESPERGFFYGRYFWWLASCGRQGSCSAIRNFSGKAVFVRVLGQASFQQKTRVIQSSFFALVFASTCCPVVLLTAVTFWLLD